MKKKLDIGLLHDLNGYIERHFKPHPPAPAESKKEQDTKIESKPEKPAEPVKENVQQVAFISEISEAVKENTVTKTEKIAAENKPTDITDTGEHKEKQWKEPELKFSRMSRQPYDPPVKVPPYHISAINQTLKEAPQTFSEYLLHLIDEKSLTDSKVYKAAQIDRRLFSKIRSDKYYQPTKTTALQLAIALKLSPRETNEFIGKAGYRLYSAIKSDVIISYFLLNGIFDLDLINSTLFAFGETPLS